MLRKKKYKNILRICFLLFFFFFKKDMLIQYVFMHLSFYSLLTISPSQFIVGWFFYWLLLLFWTASSRLWTVLLCCCCIFCTFFSSTHLLSVAEEPLPLMLCRRYMQKTWWMRTGAHSSRLITTTKNCTRTYSTLGKRKKANPSLGKPKKLGEKEHFQLYFQVCVHLRLIVKIFFVHSRQTHD